MKRYIILIALFCVGIACEKVFEDDTFVSLRTHMDTYALGDTMRIVFNNPSEQAYYYRRCGATSIRYGIYKVVGDDTLTLRGDVCNSFNQAVVEVPSKSEIELMFRLAINPPAGFDVPGFYFIDVRLVDVQNQQVGAPLNRTNLFQLVTN
jgi:hypothetical protein